MDNDAADEEALVEDSDDGWLQNTAVQLECAARAVYRSWMSERAQAYRHLQNLDELQGTAVTVQAMVFGNGGLSSGAGVAFSRDPSTGQQRQVVELLFEALGEDVVSGRRTPVTGDILRARHPALPAIRVAIHHGRVSCVLHAPPAIAADEEEGQRGKADRPPEVKQKNEENQVQHGATSFVNVMNIYMSSRACQATVPVRDARQVPGTPSPRR